MNKIIFSKYSNERAAEFSTVTQILENTVNKARFVRKYPDTAEAEMHVRKIYEWYQKLQEQYKETCVALNVCSMVEDGIQLEYMDYPSMENILDQFVESQDKKGFCAFIDQYFEVLKSVHSKKKFHITDEFQNVFGEVCFSEQELSGEYTNIDALFTNMLVIDLEHWCMLDYEWTVDFPVPLRFLLFRILFYYFHEHTFRKCAETWYPLKKIGVSEEEEEVFVEMERNFQRYIQGNRIPIRDMYHKISPGIISLDELHYIKSDILQKHKVQIYQAEKEKVTEKDSVFRLMNEENHFTYELELKQDVQYLRIDPCSCKCIVKNLTITCEGAHCEYVTNGVWINGEDLFFNNEDPYFLIQKLKMLQNKKIFIEFDVEFLEEDMVHIIQEYMERGKEEKRKEEEIERLTGQITGMQKETAELKEMLVQKEQLVKNMENTKVWKLYQKYKNLRK